MVQNKNETSTITEQSTGSPLIAQYIGPSDIIISCDTEFPNYIYHFQLIIPYLLDLFPGQFNQLYDEFRCLHAI